MRTMRRGNRFSIFVIGEPGSGKTTLERRITDVIMDRDSVDSVFVLDRLRDPVWAAPAGGLFTAEPGLIVSSIEEYTDYTYYLGREAGLDGPGIPPRVIFRIGIDPNLYVPVLQEAADQGNVLLVFCEASDWLKTHRSQWPVWDISDGLTLEAFFRQGRHIFDRAGNEQNIHFIADTQYPMDVHRLVRDSARTVLCGQIEGESSRNWVKANFGKNSAELLNEINEIERHDFVPLRDKDDIFSKIKRKFSREN